MSAELDFNTLLTDPVESFVPHLQSMLMIRGNELTPELLRFVGRQQLKEFLLAFGGKTVTFPSWESMAGCVKDAYILWRVSQIQRGDYRMVKLCAETGLNSYQIGVKVEALNSLTHKHGRESTHA